jgi:transcriptional regulator with XRE-family HTH domain
MNTNSRLIAELRDKTYRDAYVAAQIEIGLPFQARALRQAREWTQEQLAELAGMSQPRIAEIERPGKRKFNLDTLLRIASALDVGLEVRFVPLTTIIDHAESFDPDSFSIPTFAEELEEAERQELAVKARERYLEAFKREASGPKVTLIKTDDFAAGRGSEPTFRAQLNLRFHDLRLAATHTPQPEVTPYRMPLPDWLESAINPWQEEAQKVAHG